MSGIINALNLGKTGVMVGQKALEVAGNNIANVNTPGYSREVPVFTELPSISIQGIAVGSGSVINNISREHDIFLSRQIQDKNASLGAEEGKSEPLAEVERIVDISENGLAAHIDDFFNAWQTLSSDPGDRTSREAVLDSGTQLAAAFAKPVNDLQAEQQNLDSSLQSKLGELNAKFKEVAQLNQTIANIESGGTNALSARDRRDVLLKEISYSLGGTAIESASGMTSYYLPNGLPVVQDNEAYSLSLVQSGTGKALQLDMGGQPITLSADKVGGEINGLLTVRDQTIPDLIAGLDKLAFTLANQVNLVHQAGTGLDGVSGRNFFVPPAQQSGAAASLAMAVGSFSEIAAGLSSATGDNSNALALSALGGAPLIDATQTFSGYYGQLAADVGTEVSNNKLAATGNKDSLDLLNNMRDSKDGVSIEEEMVSLIQYQKSFEASAKFLGTVNDMLDTLLNVVK